MDDADGRQWILRNTVSWKRPAVESGFDHDLRSGRHSGIVVAALLLFLVVVLMAWRPSSVVEPDWLVVLIVIAALLLPARWLLYRPWTLVAEIPGHPTGDNDAEPAAERWEGTIWGPRRAWWSFWKVARSIRKHSSPGENGPLEHVRQAPTDTGP
jgi:hypothetical protein